jgi:hypothetical protein
VRGRGALRLASPLRVASVAAALAVAGPGCGRVTVADVDASGETVVDRADTCPIASCVAALRAVQDACPTVNVACLSTAEGSRVNDCFANGVQVDLDFQGDALVRATVSRPSGRVCYLVDVAAQAIGTTYRVTGAAGEPIISEYYRPGLDSTFTCADGGTLVDGPTHPCGVLRTVPDDRACTDGLCVRP